MPAPARCTTASTPSSRAASMVPALGSQPTASAVGAPGAPRTTRTTRWPPARRASTRAVPMSPEDPVTATSMARSFHENGYGGHDRVRPVQQPGLERQRALVVEELRAPRRDELGDDDRDHLVGRLFVELVEVAQDGPGQLAVRRVDGVQVDGDVVLIPLLQQFL